MSAPSCVVIVLAKAPVPGLAKTRLCPPATAEQAARIAAASLLDTLDAVRALPGAHPVVALTGDLGAAAETRELSAALAHCDVVEQRGNELGERIAAAHADAERLYPGLPSLQIGMDTPQVTAELLAECRDRLERQGTGAIIGHATDGGWWVLGLTEPHRAAAVSDVPMSRTDTGLLTQRALESSGLDVACVAELTDVDTAADAVAVAADAPGGRFAAVVAELTPAFRAEASA